MRRTERINPRTRDLDLLTVEQILQRIHREDALVPASVTRVSPSIAKAVKEIVGRLQNQGRLFLVGAGTSGRLAALEAAECPPTFGTRPSLVQAIVAGGRRALTRSVEGAEDNAVAGRRAMKKVRRTDAVIGIAASGTTPFVVGALAAAKKKGALRILVSCSPGGRSAADIRISPDPGPEVIAGSTRLKAGTATKLVLNAITVAVMTRLGKVHGNLMVDVKATNWKLRERALGIVQALTGRTDIEQILEGAGWSAKVAVVMVKRNCTARDAHRHLARHQGILRKALE